MAAPKERSGYAALGIATSAGFSLAVFLALGIGAGHYLDRCIEGLSPWGLLVGGLIGAFLGMYSLFRQLKKLA